MKGKGKGLGAIKGLALRHGEKLVMLLVLVCAGMLIWATLSHESLPDTKSPDRLTAKANQVESTIKEYQWSQAVENAPEEVRRHEALASAGAVEIDPGLYPLTKDAWDPQVVPQAELRKDPNLLPVTEFEGYGVTGLFGFIDEEEAARRALDEARSEAERERDRRLEQERMAEEQERGGRGGARGFEDGIGFGQEEGMRPVGMTRPRAGVDLDGSELIRQLSCAVVMAKVPLPEQLAEFKKALADTRTYNPSEDFPQYMGYFVERAEVNDGELDWKPLGFPNGRYNGRTDKTRFMPGVSADAIDRIVFNWAGGLEDVYDPRYGHESLTMPLAPQVGRNWDEMAYLSEIPLAADVEEEVMEEEFETLPEDASQEDMLFSGNNDAAGGRRGMGREFGGEFGGRGMRGGGEFGGRGMRGGGEYGGRGGGEFGGGFGGRGGGGGSVGRATSSLSFDENGELEVEVPFLMLRFFDLTVQPGKRYKYRVKLVMADPNYRQLLDALDPEVRSRDRQSIIYGDWSQPSPTISIPQAGIVRVAESKPPRDGYYTEPEATMLVESFGIDEKGNATQASHELSARRGAVMNYVGDVETLVDQGRYIETVEDFTIDTGVVVLDLDGGESYSRELKEPTHALLMDASGRMYLRDELDDEIEVAIHRAVFAEPDGPGGGRDMGGRGGEYGGEFGF